MTSIKHLLGKNILHTLGLATLAIAGGLWAWSEYVTAPICADTFNAEKNPRLQVSATIALKPQCIVRSEYRRPVPKKAPTVAVVDAGLEGGPTK